MAQSRPATHIRCGADAAFPCTEVGLARGMRRAIAVHTRGHWPDEAAIDTVTLAFLDRHRRRIRLVADTGTPFLLDLARAQHMSEGDGLELDNGSYIRVRAAAEPLIEIAAETATDLLRIAWHIGNRASAVAGAGGPAAHPGRPCHRRDGRGAWRSDHLARRAV